MQTIPRCERTGAASDEEAPMCTEGAPPPDGVVSLEPGITRPRLVHQRAPASTIASDPRVDGQQPRTTFKCVITREGRLENCCVVEESSRIVSKSFFWVLPDWRYEPATVNGRPISVQFYIVIDFDTGPFLSQTPRAQPPVGP